MATLGPELLSLHRSLSGWLDGSLSSTISSPSQTSASTGCLDHWTAGHTALLRVGQTANRLQGEQGLTYSHCSVVSSVTPSGMPTYSLSEPTSCKAPASDPNIGPSVENVYKLPVTGSPEIAWRRKESQFLFFSLFFLLVGKAQA